MSKRSDDAAIITLLAGAVIFVWMLFKGVFAIAGAAWRYFKKSSKDQIYSPAPHTQTPSSSPSTPVPTGSPKLIVSGYVATHSGKPVDDPRLNRVRQMMELDQWDAARRSLQQVAYGILDESQEVKAEFTKVMTIFAARDPLVSGVLQIVMPILQKSPGIRQAEMYKHVPGVGVEEVRYVLYFAEQLGMIRRQKAGNSYKLYEQSGVVDV